MGFLGPSLKKKGLPPFKKKNPVIIKNFLLLATFITYQICFCLVEGNDKQKKQFFLE